MLGVFVHLSPSIWLLIPCICLWTPFILTWRKTSKPLLLSVGVFFTAWIYVFAYYSSPSPSIEPILGVAEVRIKSVALQSNAFGEHFVYRCELIHFFPDDLEKKPLFFLPCLIVFPNNPSKEYYRPIADVNYSVSGKLSESAKGGYFFKVSSKTVWNPVPGSTSLAQNRFQWKKMVSDWIKSHFSHEQSGTFLAGLATGDFDDFWIKQQFARFGLQHLLAISGFHFAIVAGFMSFVLRLFLPDRVRIFTLLTLLGSYCFFLGPGGSILRAWVMCSLGVVGGLIEKQATALNSLGISLLVLLAYNPLFCLEIGFQLSFACTAAILLFFHPAGTWLYDLFPKRKIHEVTLMNTASQHAYCILSFLRGGIALTLAVNAFALPLTLFYFQQFPWMSLLYNLFFPFLASLSLCLLILGALFSYVPWVANVLHGVNDSFTFYLLQLTEQVPAEIDTYLFTNPFHPAWLILYISLLSLLGIIWKERSNPAAEEYRFAFI